MGFIESYIDERGRGRNAKERLQQSLLQLTQLKQQDEDRLLRQQQEAEDRRMQQAKFKLTEYNTLWSNPAWHRQMQGKITEKNQMADQRDYWAKQLDLPPQPRTNPLDSLVPDVMLKVYGLNKDPELAWLAEPYARNQIGDLLDTFSRDYWTGQDETEAQAKQAAILTPASTIKQKEMVPQQPTPVPEPTTAPPMPWDVPGLSMAPSTLPRPGVPSASEPLPAPTTTGTVQPAAEVVPAYDRTPSGMFAKWRKGSGLREEDVGANFKDPVTAKITLSIWAATPALQPKLRQVGRAFIQDDLEHNLTADEVEEAAWQSGPDNYSRIAGDAVADYIETGKLTGKAKDWVTSLAKLRPYLPATVTKEMADELAATLAASNPDFIGFRNNPPALSFFIQNMGAMTQQQAGGLAQGEAKAIETARHNLAVEKETVSWHRIQKADKEFDNALARQKLTRDTLQQVGLTPAQREGFAFRLEQMASERRKAALGQKAMKDADGNPVIVNQYTEATRNELLRQADELDTRAAAMRSGQSSPPPGRSLSEAEPEIANKLKLAKARGYDGGTIATSLRDDLVKKYGLSPQQAQTQAVILMNKYVWTKKNKKGK